MADEMVELKGGRFFHQMTVSDPAGSYYVQCSKHKHYWREIYFSDLFLSAIPESMVKVAQRALDECPSCLTEARQAKKDMSKTRFPEGAEL